jgi:hypothetical protein
MNEDIIGMSLEAKMFYQPQAGWIAELHHLERFAALVAAAEREACAELAVKGTDEPVQTKTLEILRKERERIAATIRARGQT